MSISEQIQRKDFLSCVKESKALSMVEKREVGKVSKKKVVKNRLAQLYVTGVYSNRQIADILCVSTNTVSRLLRDEEVRQAIEVYQNSEKELIDAKLKSLRERATDTMSDLLNSDDDSVRLQTAKAILDKTGHGDKKEINNNVNITYEERLQSLIEGVEFNVEVE